MAFIPQDRIIKIKACAESNSIKLGNFKNQSGFSYHELNFVYAFYDIKNCTKPPDKIFPKKKIFFFYWEVKLWSDVICIFTYRSKNSGLLRLKSPIHCSELSACFCSFWSRTNSRLYLKKKKKMLFYLSKNHSVKSSWKR